MGNTAIRSSRLRLGWEHCHRELAGGGGEGGGVVDIKSNHPHLTGGENAFVFLLKKRKTTKSPGCVLTLALLIFDRE